MSIFALNNRFDLEAEGKKPFTVLRNTEQRLSHIQSARHSIRSRNLKQLLDQQQTRIKTKAKEEEDQVLEKIAQEVAKPEEKQQNQYSEKEEIYYRIMKTRQERRRMKTGVY